MQSSIDKENRIHFLSSGCFLGGINKRSSMMDAWLTIKVKTQENFLKCISWNYDVSLLYLQCNARPNKKTCYMQEHEHLKGACDVSERTRPWKLGSMTVFHPMLSFGTNVQSCSEWERALTSLLQFWAESYLTQQVWKTGQVAILIHQSIPGPG